MRKSIEPLEGLSFDGEFGGEFGVEFGGAVLELWCSEFGVCCLVARSLGSRSVEREVGSTRSWVIGLGFDVNRWLGRVLLAIGSKERSMVGQVRVGWWCVG